MRGRSWMAAGMIAAGFVCVWTGPHVNAFEGSVENKVILELHINGLGPDGCEIRIEPGHPGCKFKPVVKKVEPGGGETNRLAPIAIVAKSTTADRDCTFAITITEPGRRPKTYRRGVRLDLASPGQALPIKPLPCHLNSPTLAAKDEQNRPRR